MGKMKMSDVFELPLELRTDLVHFSKSDTCYFKVDSVQSRDEELQVTYCIHQAINNHDSLVEEVERLRGERDSAANMLQAIIDDLDCYGELLKNKPQRIKDLLAKIKGEDNE